ncbi:MAG TPA: Asp-tRNA(Asn)/Glu-tRNA(Gln) amidotransferase subunit GatA [Puia sp.]|nr:Asp-tRNA(Asn)/Glu-tRNA(Gln) amidotransferase subunit GatA [Puia sp.]
MFSFTTIKDYHQFLADTPAGCSLAVRHYLAEISRHKDLNAFLEVFEDESLARAKTLDEKRQAGKPLGSLHGVVVAIKDIIAYKGHRMTAASRILEGYTSIFSATAIDRLLAEDAIIIGRNNCDEFAMGSTNENSAFGKVLNPIDKERVPGGSSGGSAVAVAAGLCMVSLGSDTGGSVRQPADFCGVVGLKPTYGRVSRYGLIAYGSSFDQIGVFAHSLADASLILQAIGGPDPLDGTTARAAQPDYRQAFTRQFQKLRIGYFKDAFEHPSLDREIKSRLNNMVTSLSESGHEVKPIDFEYIDYIVPAYYILTTAEASSNLSRYDGTRYGIRVQDRDLGLRDFYKKNRSMGFGKEVKRRILLGTFVLSAGYYDAYFTKAQQVRKLLIERTDLMFKQLDLIILPVSPSTAFRIGEKTEDPISMYLADIYTVYANLTGIPAVSLPLFSHSNGMPFGIQAMTSRFKELPLFQFSHQLMQQYKSYENPTL